jgi:hypothetical protein
MHVIDESGIEVSEEYGNMKHGMPKKRYLTPTAMKMNWGKPCCRQISFGFERNIQNFGQKRLSFHL